MPSKRLPLWLHAGLAFLLSTLLTWGFIQASPLYISLSQQLLSCGIAGAKWGLQIAAALLLLKDKKWLFIKNIGITCLAGSLLLVPYCIAVWIWGFSHNIFFVGSLVAAVAVMIVLYALAVKNAGIKLSWWLAWLLCLAAAITLQLTVVFQVCC